MGQYVTFQKQITVTSDTSALSSPVVEMQPMDQFADVRGWRVAFVTLHTLTITKDALDNVLIGVGTVDALRTGGVDMFDGVAGKCVSFPNLGSDEWHKAFVDCLNEPQGAGSSPIENWLGWILGVDKTGTGGPLSVTFEMFLTLKRPS